VTNRGARSRRPAIRILLAAFAAMALAVMGLPAAGASADATGTVTGTATLGLDSQITVTASANPTPPNTDVTLTAQIAVIPGNADVAPTGSVSFFDNGAPLATETLSGTAQTASWTGQLPAGTHPVTASYAGDGTYVAGLSGALELNVANLPVLTITPAGGSTLPDDGSWSGAISVDAASDATNNDYPHTRMTVDLSGVAGMTAADLGLQQSVNGSWSDVALNDQGPGHTSAVVGVDADLPPNGASLVILRLRAIKGSPAGTLSMGASLLSSTDGANWPTTLAQATQPFTVLPSSVTITTTTTVTASNAVTDGKNAPVKLTATVTPSAATGTVTFLDNGNSVGAASLNNGTATDTPALALGYHAISATYAGDENYVTSTGTQPQQISVMPPGGSLHAINPARLLDTRVALGAPKATIAPNKTLVLQVTGRGGIPASGVAAIAVDLTVVSPPSAGYVTLYPTGGAVPATADVDFPVLPTTAGLAITQLSAGGQVSILNKSASPINVVADVSAWFGQPTNSLDQQGRYDAVVPFRLLDTRLAPNKRMAAGSTVAIKVAGVSGIPATGVTAVMLNVTSVKPAGFGYLVTYPGGLAKPKTSTSQFQKNETRAGRVIVGVGTDGKVDIYNSTLAATDVLVDIVGWFTTGSSQAGGMTYVPLPVSRRLSSAQTSGAAWGQNAARAVPMAGVLGVPSLASAIRATAVVTNVHTVNASASSYITAYPLAIRPKTSDLDFALHQNLQNLTIAGLGSTGGFNLYNMAGTVTVPIDLFGWFG
jgi:Bacterial Ig-like domain (group 3)